MVAKSVQYSMQKKSKNTQVQFHKIYESKHQMGEAKKKELLWEKTEKVLQQKRTGENIVCLNYIYSCPVKLK